MEERKKKDVRRIFHREAQRARGAAAIRHLKSCARPRLRALLLLLLLLIRNGR